MKNWKIILWPLASLYGFVTWLRNKLYDSGVFASKTFDIPVIAVGNLTYGGSGKTPHTEYLIRLLHEKFALATLSRGYGRSTSGFILASDASTSSEIGDEPKQFKRKFPGVNVAVDGNRVHGIKKLLQMAPGLGAVLLDDAFQHRAVMPGLNILLTDYGRMYCDDALLPVGTLRESKKGVERADIIIVTKTPPIFSPLDRRLILKKIKHLPHQHVYFTRVQYGNFIPMLGEKRTAVQPEVFFEKKYSFLLLTGIANATPLVNFLKARSAGVRHIEFGDHHSYGLVDMHRVKSEFDAIAGPNKIVLTTEKDAMRIDKPGLIEVIGSLPVYYVPIEIAFQDQDGEQFNRQVFDFIRAKFVINSQ